MTKEQIDNLILEGEFPVCVGGRELVETHISWVILCDGFVYKIKKPIKYSFLDFSTLDLRKHFCEREIKLNKRFADGIYLDVLPVYESQGRYSIGTSGGNLIDYAVRMHRLATKKQMDHLLVKGKVSKSDIRNLADKIASFHKSTATIYEKDVLDVQHKFNDLAAEKGYLAEELGSNYSAIIEQAVKASDQFLEKNEELLVTRLKEGYFKDCHGDLHSRNIFLLPAPQPFDCIEFNDDYRQIDVLNEVAFLCMDLDAFGRQDLSDLFLEQYNQLFPTMKTDEEYNLFIYYKSYRANVRAKVNSLRARSAATYSEKTKVLSEANKYICLMEGYMKSIGLI